MKDTFIVLIVIPVFAYLLIALLAVNLVWFTTVSDTYIIFARVWFFSLWLSGAVFVVVSKWVEAHPYL